MKFLTGIFIVLVIVGSLYGIFVNPNNSIRFWTGQEARHPDEFENILGVIAVVIFILIILFS